MVQAADGLADRRRLAEQEFIAGPVGAVRARVADSGTWAFAPGAGAALGESATSIAAIQQGSYVAAADTAGAPLVARFDQLPQARPELRQRWGCRGCHSSATPSNASAWGGRGDAERRGRSSPVTPSNDVRAQCAAAAGCWGSSSPASTPSAASMHRSATAASSGSPSRGTIGSSWGASTSRSWLTAPVWSRCPRAPGSRRTSSSLGRHRRQPRWLLGRAGIATASPCEGTHRRAAQDWLPLACLSQLPRQRLRRLQAARQAEDQLRQPARPYGGGLRHRPAPTRARGTEAHQAPAGRHLPPPRQARQAGEAGTWRPSLYSAPGKTHRPKARHGAPREHVVPGDKLVFRVDRDLQGRKHPADLRPHGPLMPSIGTAPIAAGIVNVTTDSMFEGARSGTPEPAVEDGMGLVEEGFEMLDVGAVAGGRARRSRRRGGGRGAGPGGRGAGRPPSACRSSADTFSAEVARGGARRRGGRGQRHRRRRRRDARAGRRARLRLRPDAHRGAAAGRPRGARLRRRRRAPEGAGSRGGSSARWSWGSTRSRSRSTPASTST